MSTTSYDPSRIAYRKPVPITAANETPVLAPPRRPRYEVSVCKLGSLQSVMERRDLLNDLGLDGWQLVGVDDGIAYLQRQATD